MPQEPSNVALRIVTLSRYSSIIALLGYVPLLVVHQHFDKKTIFMPQKNGKVYLVGAGPGDPSLLTLRGRELLQQADAVFYDYLVNPQVLVHTKPSTEQICLGRHGHGRIHSQEEINALVLEAAQAGKIVVRLKGGDPAFFGRTAEEITSLESANIPYEVVPGVTAASAASSYAGIPLTHREHASSVAFITGQQCRDNDAHPLDLANLAKFPGTLVFYMGVTSAPQWSAQLIKHGKSASTPVAIVRRASLPQQQTVRTTLGELAEVLAPQKMRPPAIIIVGEAVEAETTTKWFQSRPLFGSSVLVTRPVHQATELVECLSNHGAAPLIQPAITIAPPSDWAPADQAIRNLRAYDWLVFSSVNGVEQFITRMDELGFDLRQLGNCQIAAIGPATAKALRQFHLRVDLQPNEYRAEALTEMLAPKTVGKRVLLLRASRGREVLAESLTAAGARVKQVVVYQSNDVEQADPEIMTALEAGQIDWMTVTSSAIARSLVHLFGGALAQTKLAAISPLTAKVLTEAGYPPSVVAKQYTTEGLVDAILNAADVS